MIALLILTSLIGIYMESLDEMADELRETEAAATLAALAQMTATSKLSLSPLPAAISKLVELDPLVIKDGIPMEFHTWAIRAKITFQSIPALWDIVSELRKTFTPSELILNGMAWQLIMKAIPNLVLDLVDLELSAAKIWITLQERYGNRMMVERAMKLRCFLGLTMSSGESIQQYLRVQSYWNEYFDVACWNNIYTSLDQIAKDNLNHLYMDTIVAGISNHPEHLYEHAVSQLSVKLADDDLDLQTVRNIIGYAEAKIEECQHQELEAMAVNTKFSYLPKCYNCGGLGHMSDVCPSPKSASSSSTKGSSSSLPSSTKSNKERKKKYHHKPTQGSGSESAAVQVVVSSNAVNAKSGSVLADSGTSHNITSDSTIFSPYSHVSNVSVTIANKSKSSATHIGTITLPVSVNGVQKNIRLTNSYFVPEFPKTLISMGKLWNDGYTWTVDQKSHSIIISEESTQAMVAVAPVVHGVYVLKQEAWTDATAAQVNSASLLVSNSLLWHRHLGHVNHQFMKRMVSKKLV